MLWAFVAPFKLSLLILFGIASILIFGFMFLRVSLKVKIISFLTIIILSIIPTCVFVTRKIDEDRFGLFTYGNYSEITDVKIKELIPVESFKIKILQKETGFIAEYEIEETYLRKFMDKSWKNLEEFSVNEDCNRCDNGVNYQWKKT